MLAVSDRHGAWHERSTAPIADRDGTRLHELIEERVQQGALGRPALLPGLCGELASAAEDRLSPPSDEVLRRVVQRLVEVVPSPARNSYDTDCTVPVRWVGDFYEHLQRFAATPVSMDKSGARFELTARPARRKSAGMFYTPQPIVEYLVEQAVAWPFDDWSVSAAPLTPDSGQSGNATFCVLDPAVGGGNFLLAAWQALTARWLAWLERVPKRQAARLLDSWRSQQNVTDCRPDAQTVVARQVAASSLYGIDRDPLATDVARWSLWQVAGGNDVLLEPISNHVRCGDALSDALPEVSHSTAADRWESAFAHVFSRTERRGFDAVIGNPPYGASVSPAEKLRLRARFPQMRHNSDTAVGFLQRALEWIHPQGHVGYVLPKPLTYSYAWRHVRRLIAPRIESVCDLSCAWPDVRLEQVALTLGPAQAGDLRSETWQEGQATESRQIPKTWMARFGTVPSALCAQEVAWLSRMAVSDVTIGDLCKTTRGLPWQRLLRPSGTIPVVGGRDLQRWGLRGASGYLAKQTAEDALARFAAPKLVFQNIVAHIQRPAPHVRLIGAYDANGTITLDTVNNLVARRADVDLRSILALLHSRFVNWYVYTVVYNKAIRTMHFDQYFLDKIPLPSDFASLLNILAPLAREAEHAIGEPDRLSRIERQMNLAVDAAYGCELSDEGPAGPGHVTASGVD